MKTPGTMRIHGPDKSKYIDLHTFVGGQTTDLAAQLLILPETLLSLSQIKWYADRGLFFRKALEMRKNGYWMRDYSIFMDTWSTGLYLDVFPESLSSMLILQNPQLFVANAAGPSDSWEGFEVKLTVSIEENQPPNLVVRPTNADETWNDILKAVEQVNDLAYDDRAHVVTNFDGSFTMNLDMMLADRLWRQLKNI